MGKLLEDIYADYVTDAHIKLKMESNIFGIAIMGDGATFKKMPLFNVLFSSRYLPVYVSRILDFLEGLAVGQNKNGGFLASSIRPLMNEIDPNKLLIDLALFDV